ncbi:hypothetical protein DFH05DRAFT_1390396 [Lentinula detonsa]|uniref:VWFA domain-containing protein n=1 Tax=Lentinula detonsa TaxID=2804962 RepID=A0A9W8P8L5_9AGAR|nr:hypothetical protein DFH05DRAFT_1390396 [Lentinula detonsa]KAJ3984414.1 hypothetical protein F5890DRAFT_1411620 [Lentinula detonsa]
MPLEATMMVIDNSEYMRNGDYQPNRFDAQADAVNVVFQTKIDSNPENTVGIMSMAGKGPEVLVTHSKDIGQILKAIHTTSSKVGGAIDIPTAIAVAQLALKHRENKNLRQRIIVFVGSPLEGPAADEKGMVKLAKKLKKNNVAVDVVCFGDGIEEPVSGQEDKSVLKSFVENANSADNSHLVVVPPGPRLISDALISSPILSDDRSASIPTELGGTGGDGPGASSGGDFEFGVDPSLDPELAMALRISMQEAQAREAASSAEASSSNASQPTTSTVPAQSTEDEEEALLAQAIKMSSGEDVDMESSGTTKPSETDAVMNEDDEDEEEAIARAIAMSMQQDEQDKK